jgi:hypothetical protein
LPGVLAIGLQSNFLTNYTNFILLLYVLIPWTAINLVDYYRIRHGEYEVEAFSTPAADRTGASGGSGSPPTSSASSSRSLSCRPPCTPARPPRQ